MTRRRRTRVRRNADNGLAGGCRETRPGRRRGATRGAHQRARDAVLLERRTTADAWISIDGSGPGRGITIEEEIEIDGEIFTQRKPNPALDAGHALSRRQREIGKELSLYPGYQDD
jgi:hypothetical protein